jgi:hypothetical protein
MSYYVLRRLGAENAGLRAMLAVPWLGSSALATLTSTWVEEGTSLIAWP